MTSGKIKETQKKTSAPNDLQDKSQLNENTWFFRFTLAINLEEEVNRWKANTIIRTDSLD
jgi:hypothetical protein